MLQKVWNGYEARGKESEICEWLPTFLDALIVAIGSEVKWTLQNLPDHYPAIVISLLVTFSQKIQHPLEQAVYTDLQRGRLRFAHSKALFIDNTNFMTCLFSPCLQDSWNNQAINRASMAQGPS